MGYNANWDEWGNLHLILDERLSGFLRRIKNFVMDGYQLTPGVGLFVQVGQAGLNIAYVNGYELKQTYGAPVLLPVADNTLNQPVYLEFTKTVDPGGGYQAITIFLTVGAPTTPVDWIRLGEVDAAGGLVTAIRNDDNRYHIHSGGVDIVAVKEDISFQAHMGDNIIHPVE